jgi:hypothetical protein
VNEDIVVPVDPEEQEKFHNEAEYTAEKPKKKSKRVYKIKGKNVLKNPTLQQME